MRKQKLSIPKELDPYIEKIITYVVVFIISFFLLLFIKDIAINGLTQAIGEENAKKVVSLIFLTPSKLIFEQYGITFYSIILVAGYAYVSQNKQNQGRF